MTDAAPPRWNRRDWLVLLAYLAIAHLVFLPALKANVFLYGRDTTAHDYGMLHFYWSEILDHGRLALWNPHLFCGFPSLGTFAFCPLYPSTWLVAVLPFALAFTYQYIVNNWLAGWWTYWAAGKMGLRRPGAFFAGLVFMVSGHFVTLVHAGHFQKFAAIAWIPFAIGCATAAIRQVRVPGSGFRVLGYWLGCGAGLGAQLLASHVQIAYYTVGVLVCWTIWLAVGRKRGERVSALWSGAVGLILAGVVAGGLSAAQMLPGLETTPYTNRGGGMDFASAAATSYPPFEFIEYVLPGFLGDSVAGSPVAYWGEWGTERIVTDYPGLLPLLLLFFGLWAGGDRNRWFWLVVIVVAACLAAGRYTPVYRLAFDWVPGLNRFRSPGTIMVFIAWPMAILAAMGLEAFLDRAQRGEGRAVYVLIPLGAGAVLGVLGGLLVPEAADSSLAQSLGLSFLKRPSTRAESIYTSLQRSFLFGALACAALAAVAALVRSTAKRSLRTAVALGIVYLVAFLDPRLHASRYVRAIDVRPFHLYLFSHWSDPILRALPKPVRGIQTGNERTNRMMTRGIGSLHGYHPVFLQNYIDLLDVYAQDHPKLGRLVFEQFVLAPPDRPPGPEYQRREAGNGQILWLRRPPLHYVWFPQEVAVSDDNEVLLIDMANREFDPYARSWTLDPQLEYRQGAGSTATVRLAAWSPNRIDLEAATSEDRPLVMAELAAPGWRCIVDSTLEIPVRTANHALRAVRVPAGEHSLSFRYEPFSARMGFYLTFLTAMVLAAAGIAGLGRRFQPRDGEMGERKHVPA